MSIAEKTAERLSALASAAERELRDDILPFWAEHAVDRELGGFYGWVSNDLLVDREAAKGAVLNTRILWAFSATLTHWPEEKLYRELADRAYEYILEHFWDQTHSGLVWQVDSRGEPLDERKQTYGQAFGIYALAEYFRAGGEQEALERAIKLFEAIEAKAFEPAGGTGDGSACGGYVEALARDWSPLEDMRLSPIDLNVPYSQNTHLHLLEAYATLSRVWPEPAVLERLKVLWEILALRIRDAETNRLILFQDRDWRPLSPAISHGHDIEASWLLYEAAGALGDPELLARTKEIALFMAEDVLKHGFDREHGGVSDGVDHDMSRLGKEWWPQAEAVVGFLNAFELSGRDEFLDAALECWNFIDKHVIDHTYGEWFYRVSPEGVPELDLPKVSPWKCPYHNARASLEIIERVERLAST